MLSTFYVKVKVTKSKIVGFSKNCIVHDCPYGDDEHSFNLLIIYIEPVDRTTMSGHEIP